MTFKRFSSLQNKSTEYTSRGEAQLAFYMLQMQMGNMLLRLAKPITGLLLSPNSVGTSAENVVLLHAPVLPVLLTPSSSWLTANLH